MGSLSSILSNTTSTEHQTAPAPPTEHQTAPAPSTEHQAAPTEHHNRHPNYIPLLDLSGDFPNFQPVDNRTISLSRRELVRQGILEHRNPRRDSSSTGTDTDMDSSDEIELDADSPDEATPRGDNGGEGVNLATLFQESGQVDQSPLERSRGIMAVFRMLIRSGQINVMSSGEDSEGEEEDEDEDYLPENPRRIRPPKQVYTPDLQNIQKNDIYLRLQDTSSPTTVTGTKQGLAKMLLQRELGLSGSCLHNGFDNKKKARITSHFFPNNVRKICNFGYKAFCGTYSKDGSIFLSAAQDRAIRIFDTAKGRFQEKKKIGARDVGWSVLDTAFSPDGRYVAYSSWSEAIHICSLSGDERHESLSLVPDNRRFCIFSIAFSDCGSEILGGANDGFLYIYDRDLNQRVLKISAHEDDVNAVAFADQTSQILFSVADDALVKVWDRRCLNESSPSPVGILAGHIDGITFVDSMHDGRYLITNSKDQSIKLWDLRAFSSQQTSLVCRETMDKNRWDYRWQRVPKRLSLARECVAGDTSVMTYRGHSVLNTLIRCRFSPPNSTNQRFIYTGCAAGRVVIYDILTGQVVRSLTGHEGVVRDVSWHPDTTEIVSTSWDGSIGYWTCESQHALTQHDEEILGIHSNPNILRRSSRLAKREVAELQSMMDAE